MQLSLKNKYYEEVQPKVASEFGVKNRLAVPRLEKIVINVGVGGITKDKAKVSQLKKDIASIAGQAPAETKAKSSIAGFGIREGLVVGLKVTLRGVKMYDFLAKLFAIVLPRLRDFRGVSIESFDERGNYTLGIKEHSVFPEVDISKSGTHGMEITLVTTGESVEQSKRVLVLLGMPFEKEDKQ